MVHHDALAECKANAFSFVLRLLIVQALKYLEHFFGVLILKANAIIAYRYAMERFAGQLIIQLQQLFFTYFIVLYINTRRYPFPVKLKSIIQQRFKQYL